MKDFLVESIAHIENGYAEKFGVPRQSGLVEEVISRVVFEPKYRNADALRGIEGYSHLWLLWLFDGTERGKWSPTVRPPRLGGNERMGVFATRSPFRPNPIGLSCVKLIHVDWDTSDGPVLVVGGADLMNQTQIVDVKPYLPYTDAHTNARWGFAEDVFDKALQVEFAPGAAACLDREDKEVLSALLKQDPRPAYQDDPNREYGFIFEGKEIRFSVEGTLVTVRSVINKT